MVKTFTLTTEVLPDREVRVTLPADVPLGPADIVVVVAPHTTPAVRTLGDLLASDYVGMWQERTDIHDSAEFARQLREAAWRRSE